jgi:release factor glutamine methyltransferase
LQRSIQQLLAGDAAKLAVALALDASAARIEVQSLLRHVLNVSRAWLLAHSEQMPDQAQLAAYQALFQRRLSGEPLAYILGEREFFGLAFKVSPATLIPRPETELLVDLALQRLPRHGVHRVLDLGTGSGAIALSIALARPDVEVWACDASAEALGIAQENAQRFQLHNVRLIESDWFAALPAMRFDLIVSNPPYIAEGDPHLSLGDLRFEPARALAAGKDGLRDIRHLVNESKPFLAEGAWLLFEHGYDQAARVRTLLQEGGYCKVFSVRDLAGIERVSGASLRVNVCSQTV